MISLPDRLPLVRHRKGYATPFNLHWVDNSLRAAARAAGYEKWWLAGHVAEGVHTYLGEYHEGCVVTTGQVERAVQMILEGIGYEEVARLVRLTPPPVEVPLPSIAERAHGGYELAFFQLLDEEIGRLLDSGVENLRFSGLRYSVKLLGDAQRWSRSCSDLSREIVAFLGHRLGAAAGRRIAFAIA